MTKMWLIGAGYWGSKLKKNLEDLSVDVHVIDIKQGNTINDIDTVDPVILATPLWDHYTQVCQLLDNGHDVYVEKPMAETLDQIDDIQQHLKPNQLLMVGHIFVHHPQLAVIKNLINQDKIGSLMHISSRRLNWGIYQTKTDPLLSLATHDISILLEFLNNIKVTDAKSWNYSKNSHPDRIYFSGKDDAVSFDVDVSWHWPFRVRETIFIGSEGQIVWDQDLNTIQIFNHKILHNRAVIDPCPTTIEYTHKLTPLASELSHWITCVKTRTSPSTGIGSARRVAELIDQTKSLL